MDEISKLRMEGREKEKHGQGLLQAIQHNRQKLFVALGQAMGNKTTERVVACNNIADMPHEDRSQFILKHWSQAHLDRVETQLQQLRRAEEQYRSFSEEK